MITELCRFAAEPQVQQITTKKGTSDEAVLSKVTVPVTYEANGNYHIINIEAWGKQAEYIERTFSKGEWAYITGKLIRKEWQDANGYKKHDYYILITSIRTLPVNKPISASSEKDKAIEAYYNYGLDEIPPLLQD